MLRKGGFYDYIWNISQYDCILACAGTDLLAHRSGHSRPDDNLVRRRRAHRASNRAFRRAGRAAGDYFLRCIHLPFGLYTQNFRGKAPKKPMSTR